MITELDAQASLLLSRDDVEVELRVLVGEGRMERAATLMIETYGPELYGFLVVGARCAHRGHPQPDAALAPH